MFSTIQIEYNGNVANIWLNRPEVKNAFNDIMVRELTSAFEEVGSNHQIKVVILRGRGNVFCSGADLNWMRNVSEMNFEQNYSESLVLANCMYTLYSLPKPVIVAAQGAVKGGGNGLLAAADIAICTNSTEFAFTEVKLGVVPAVISPYVVARIGQSRAKELMLTARVFSGVQAESYGLVNVVVEENEMTEQLGKYTDMILGNSLEAMQKTKELLFNLPELNQRELLIELTANTIAAARISRDGQEGMSAFLEKRKPNW
jgi:methylglutaconyl-CoA hydratase